MRLLHVTDHLELVGGKEVYIADFAVRSTEAGWHNRVMTANSLGDALDDRDVGEAARVEGRRPDAIVLHSPDAWALAPSLARIAPCIGWSHDHAVFCPGGMAWYPDTGEDSPFRVGWHCAVNAYRHQCAPRRPDRLWAALSASGRAMDARPHLRFAIVASRFMRTRLAKAGFEPSDLAVLPYFQDWATADTAQAAVDEGRPTILCVSRLHEAKGLHVLLTAMAHIRTSCELVILGTGSRAYEGAIRRQAAGLTNSDVDVTFQGTAEDRDALGAFYRRASVVVVPSLWPEPFGIVGLDAMAFERPVVAFDVGGIREWLVHDEVGLLARPGDPEHLAHRLDSLLQDGNRRRRLGREGRRRATTHFSWDAHFEAFRSALASFRVG